MKGDRSEGRKERGKEEDRSEGKGKGIGERSKGTESKCGGDAKTSGEGARVVCVRVCCAHGPSRLLRVRRKGKVERDVEPGERRLIVKKVERNGDLGERRLIVRKEFWRGG